MTPDSPAGYSGTPLYRKLGIKSGMRITVVDPPEHYRELLPGMPADVEWVDGEAGPLDLAHAFVMSREALRRRLPRLRAAIAQNGMIWISWPKKSSGVPTDVTGDVVRAEAIAAGLVDVKVCAVDGVWSGLKLVIPKADRR